MWFLGASWVRGLNTFYLIHVIWYVVAIGWYGIFVQFVSIKWKKLFLSSPFVAPDLFIFRSISNFGTEINRPPPKVGLTDLQKLFCNCMDCKIQV